jgi:hypothetical protein
MDWKTFVSNLIDSLAWPVALGVMVWILKKPLTGLLSIVGRLKYKDFEIEFSRSVKDLVKKSEDAELPSVMSGEEGERDFERLYTLAEVSPRSAIIEAWLKVENVAAEVIQKKGLAEFGRTPVGPLRLGKLLQKARILSNSEMEVFNKLRYLRNEAVHVEDAKFQPSEVASYLDTAEAMARNLIKKSI